MSNTNKTSTGWGAVISAAIVFSILLWNGCTKNSAPPTGTSLLKLSEISPEAKTKLDADLGARFEAARLEREAQERARKYKATIERVDQAVEAIMQKPGNQLSFSDRYYSATALMERVSTELREVDTSDSPEEFRIAYLEFVHATENRKTVEDQITGVKGLIKMLSGDVSGPKQGEEANKRIKEATNKLEQIALKYNAKLNYLR